jgi:TPR repeat protein
MLLSDPAAGMTDVPRAIEEFERAWNRKISMAAYQLGGLYEHGVPGGGGSSYLVGHVR